MVARIEPPPPVPQGDDPSGDPVSGLFRAWRRLVTSAGDGLRAFERSASRSRPARAARMALAYVRDPAGTLARADADGLARLAEAGAAALAVGAALSWAVSGALGLPPVRRFLAIGWTAAWALARLLIMRLASRERPSRAGVLEAVWGASLLPYLGAVAAPLDLVALAASAFLAHKGLVAVGTARGEARRVVLIAFGGQLVAEIAAWVARGGLVLGLALLR
ncbi:MAG TPA: hypothetical protein VF902_06660 [Coriobacteriia bacterium]